MLQAKVNSHPIFCDFCLKTFASGTFLKLHEDLVHKNSLRTNFENQENEIDLEIQILQIEIEILEIEIGIYETQNIDHIAETVQFCYRPIYCDICLKVFAAKSTLHLHIEIFHEKLKRNSSKNDVVIKIDHENVATPFEIEYMSKINNPKMKNKKLHKIFFSCNICQKLFTIKRFLKIHMRSSTERPLQCDKCQNSFSQESSLNMHSELQRGESSRDFHSCNQCLKLFSLQVYFRTQVYSHTCGRCLRLIINNQQVWIASKQNKIFQVF